MLLWTSIWMAIVVFIRNIDSNRNFDSECVALILILFCGLNLYCESCVGSVFYIDFDLDLDFYYNLHLDVDVGCYCSLGVYFYFNLWFRLQSPFFRG